MAHAHDKIFNLRQEVAMKQRANAERYPQTNTETIEVKDLSPQATSIVVRTVVDSPEV